MSEDSVGSNNVACSLYPSIVRASAATASAPSVDVQSVEVNEATARCNSSTSCALILDVDVDAARALDFASIAATSSIVPTRRGAGSRDVGWRARWNERPRERSGR